GPHHLPGCRVHAQPKVRLQLRTGEVVPADLRTHDHVGALGDDWKLVLHERADVPAISHRGFEPEPGDPDVMRTIRAGRAAEDQRVAASPEPLLYVDLAGVAAFLELQR